MASARRSSKIGGGAHKLTVLYCIFVCCQLMMCRPMGQS